MSRLLKYDEVRLDISECNTMGELKGWNERLKDHLEIANYKQDLNAVEDALKIAVQISERMKHLLLIQGDLIKEMANEI
jgi:hypothetical protein